MSQFYDFFALNHYKFAVEYQWI